MFYIKDESDIAVNGFNFYPLSSVGNFGFRFRWNNIIWRFRYSKFAKKWFIGKLSV
jgi:hypothetical protein